MEGYDAVAYYDTDIEFQAPAGPTALPRLMNDINPALPRIRNIYIHTIIPLNHYG